MAPYRPSDGYIFLPAGIIRINCDDIATNTSHVMDTPILTLQLLQVYWQDLIGRGAGGTMNHQHPITVWGHMNDGQTGGVEEAYKASKEAQEVHGPPASRDRTSTFH
jgi:hypothetical protein